MTDRDPRIVSAVLCDDVRHEIDSKMTLVGIYTGAIQVQKLPSHFTLSLYTEIVLPAGTYQVGFRLTIDGEVHSGMEGEVNVTQYGPVSLPTPRLPVMISSECTIIAEGQIDGGEWFTVTEKRVLGPVTTQ